MKFTPADAVDLLCRTPDVLRAMLGDLRDDWTARNYGGDTFSPFDVVGHLLHGERTDWMVRLRIIIEHGEAQPFEPFDRYAQRRENVGRTMNELLDAFAKAREQNLADLSAIPLDDAALQRTGTHPELGRVTLGQLLATWVVHDLHHIAQICKAMAYQYHDQVGPWRAYLSIIEQAERGAEQAAS